MSSRPTPDREGFPARIPEYVFTTAAIVTANPDVKARLPWFRRAVESAFMNGYEAGKRAGLTDAAVRKAQADAVRGAAHGISGPLAGALGEAAGRLVVSTLEKIADEIEHGEGGERR